MEIIYQKWSPPGIYRGRSRTVVLQLQHEIAMARQIGKKKTTQRRVEYTTGFLLA